MEYVPAHVGRLVARQVPDVVHEAVMGAQSEGKVDWGGLDCHRLGPRVCSAGKAQACVSRRMAWTAFALGQLSAVQASLKPACVG